MALFSRRPKDVPGPAEGESSASAEPHAGAADSPAAEAPAQTEADAAASVSISVTSYGGLGAAAPQPPQPAPPQAPEPQRAARAATETAPAQTQTVPGVRDNVLVREALAKVAETPGPQAVLDVARQVLQGHLFLRVKGDARSLLAEGKPLPLAMVTVGERRFALAYSSGAALQASVRADGDTETSAMGQPVLTVLRHVLAGPYDGLILDHSSAPARAVLPTELLQKLMEKADEELTVKTLLAGERTPETAARLVEAMTRVPLWVAVGKLADGRPGIAEGRSTDGRRYLEVFSHPLEVAVMGRSDQAAPLTAAQLAGALAGDADMAGVIVDPAGPWMQLSRDDLGPLLAQAR